MTRLLAAPSGRVWTAIRILLGVVVAYCVLQTAVQCGWNISRFNSGADVFSFALFMMEDTTMYADRYTEAGFKQVNVSMTSDEVRRILGEPLSRQAVKNGEWWRYTRGLPDMNYWLRVVEVDTDGRVRGKIRQYWDD